MSRPEVTVVDYGLGNLLSVQRGLEHCGARVRITSEFKELLAADRVVLPGVGAYGSGMQTLRSLGLDSAIRQFAARGQPLLGLCLGMQLLLDESDEFGPVRGLGLISGRVVAIPGKTVAGEPQKIPHIGWNALRPTREGGWAGTLLEDTAPGEAAYFVHAFMAVLKDDRQRLADCDYGGHSVTAAIQQGVIGGCQFHPEKSGEVGLKILRRFLRY